MDSAHRTASGSVQLIVSADDLGMSSMFDAVIADLVSTGLVSSCSLMVTRVQHSLSAAAQEVVRAARNRQISCGVHLEWEGDLREQMILDQIRVFRSITGLLPSHLDVHKAHSRTAWHDVIGRVANDHGVPTRNYGGACESRVTTTTGCFMATGRPLAEIERWLDGLESGDHELVIHPGRYDPQCSSTLNAERAEDVNVARHVGEWRHRRGISLATFWDLCGRAKG